MGAHLGRALRMGLPDRLANSDPRPARESPAVLRNLGSGWLAPQSGHPSARGREAQGSTEPEGENSMPRICAPLSSSQDTFVGFSKPRLARARTGVQLECCRVAPAVPGVSLFRGVLVRLGLRTGARRLGRLHRVDPPPVPAHTVFLKVEFMGRMGIQSENVGTEDRGHH